MNRRSFFTKLAVAAAGFTILPPATTYERIWRPAPKVIKRMVINPEWVTARYMISFQWYKNQPPSQSYLEDGLPRFNERPEGGIVPIYKWIDQ